MPWPLAELSPTNKSPCGDGKVEVNDVIEGTASRDPCSARRLARRCGDRCRGGADLSDHLVSVSRYRACRQLVCLEGAGQHLHSHHEPDQRRAGETSSRVGGWCCRT